MNQTDQEPNEAAAQEETPRIERKARGLARIDNFPYQKGEKSKPERVVINTEVRPSSAPEPSRTPKDTPTILEKRRELQRLELEIKLADQARSKLERKLQSVQHEISARTGELNIIASQIHRVEDKELPAQFLQLWRRSLNGGLDQHDWHVFSQCGLILSNRKMLTSLLRSEAADLDTALAVLEKEESELRETLAA